MNITFNGIWRMDWGFGNPNITAALIASLLILVWLPAFFFRRGFWLSLPLSVVLGICLIHTLSRGGILGGIVGLGTLVLLAPRPWPGRRIAAAALCFWIVILGGYFLKAHERMGHGIVREDKSISHRLAIWKVAPQMLSANPAGWGWHQSGRAYMDWYQSPDRTEQYGSLVNTHLSKVVELGILGGAAYLLVWALALIVCWPSSRAKWRAVPFATLVAFGTAALFTNMAREPLVWIAPALSLLAVLVERIVHRSGPSLPPVMVAGLASVALPLGLFLVGRQADSPMRISEDVVFLGSPAADKWILNTANPPNDTFPRVLRRYLSNRPNSTSLAIATSVRHLPDGLTRPVLVTGDLSSEDRSILAKKCLAPVTFVTPDFPPNDLPGSIQPRAIYGEFSNSPHAVFWQDSGQCLRLPGVADYIADWQTHILKPFLADNSRLPENDKEHPPGPQ